MKILIQNNTRVSFFKKTNNICIKKNLLNKNGFYQNITYDYYLYSFFLKKNFSNTSVNRKNKQNNNHTNTFITATLKRGLKLKSLKFVNEVRLRFYFFFKKKLDFFQKKFPTYGIFYNFSQTEKRFFNINFVLDLILKNNDTIFSSKAIKLNKKIKQKNKTKAKYALDLHYIKSDKRINFTLKQLHLYSNNYNFYKYGERLLASLFNVFFLEKGSDIYKNKLATYRNILKKNSK